MYNSNVTFDKEISKESVDNYPRQFDVVFADLPYVEGAPHFQRGLHPAIILSSNNNNRNSSNLTVIPITSKINKGRHLQTHLFLNLEAAKSIGLYKPSVVQAECTMPIDKSMIKRTVGHVKHPKMIEAIKKIMNVYIGFLYEL